MLHPTTVEEVAQKEAKAKQLRAELEVCPPEKKFTIVQQIVFVFSNKVTNSGEERKEKERNRKREPSSFTGRTKHRGVDKSKEYWVAFEI